MKMHCLLKVLFALLLFTNTYSKAAELYRLMPKEAVLFELGDPVSQLKRGEREILIWGGGVKIVFEKGLAKEFEGIDYNYLTPEQMAEYGPSEPAEEPVPDAKAEAVPTAPVQPAIPPEAVPETMTQELPPEPYPSDPEGELIDALGVPTEYSAMTDEEAQQAFTQLMASEMDLTEKETALLFGTALQTEEEQAMDALLTKALEFIFSAIIAFAVLKGASHVTGMPILAGELFTIAISYAAFGLLLGLVPWMYEVRSLFYVDRVISMIVLSLLIFHFSAVSNGITALKIALTTSLISYFGGLVFFALGSFVLYSFA